MGWFKSNWDGSNWVESYWYREAGGSGDEVFETITVAGTQSAALAALASRTDLLAPSDLSSNVVAALSALVETLGVADAEEAQLAATATRTENVAAADSEAAQLAAVAARAESAATASAESAQLAAVAAASELLSLAAAEAAQLAAVAARSESTAVAEFDAAQLAALAAASDIVSAAEADTAALSILATAQDGATSGDDCDASTGAVSDCDDLLRISDRSVAQLTPAFVPSGGGGGGGDFYPGPWVPESPSPWNDDGDLLVSSPAKVDLRRLQDRYQRHTQYLRKSMEQLRAELDLVRAQAELGALGDAKRIADLEAEISRLQREKAAPQQLEAKVAQLRLSVKGLVARAEGQGYLKKELKPAPVSLRPAAPLAGVPQRPSLRPYLLVAAVGLAAAGAWVPRMKKANRKALYFAAGAAAAAWLLSGPRGR